MNTPKADSRAPGSSVTSQVIPRVGAQTNRRARVAALEPLADRQRFVLARRQLTALGWSDGQIAHEIEIGRWQVPARGVVVLHTGTPEPVQRLWIGVLYAGSGAVLSHLTAAREAGVRWVGDERIHVLTPKGDLVPALKGYCFHQTRRPYRQWLTPIAGAPPRLPVEHAVLMTAERDRSVRRAIGLLARSVQQQVTTAERLQLTIPTIHKLRNKSHFRLALGDIAGGAQSFAEIDLGVLCADAGLAAPSRQVIRLDKDGRRRFLDAEWRRRDGQRIVLEVDGSFHLQVENWWNDMRRERRVVLGSGIVLRCSTVELRLSPSDVIEDLREAGVPDRFVQDLPA